METGFVQAGATRLQCFASGYGPETVVFVHGYTASGRIWRLVQEALDPTRFRTIALSNRGAGDSDRSPREEDYTVEAFAADLFGAVHTLGLTDFTLVGHSMGGATVTQCFSIRLRSTLGRETIRPSEASGARKFRISTTRERQPIFSRLSRPTSIAIPRSG